MYIVDTLPNLWAFSASIGVDWSAAWIRNTQLHHNSQLNTAGPSFMGGWWNLLWSLIFQCTSPFATARSKCEDGGGMLMKHCRLPLVIFVLAACAAVCGSIAGIFCMRTTAEKTTAWRCAVKYGEIILALLGELDVLFMNRWQIFGFPLVAHRKTQ